MKKIIIMISLLTSLYCNFSASIGTIFIKNDIGQIGMFEKIIKPFNIRFISYSGCMHIENYELLYYRSLGFSFGVMYSLSKNICLFNNYLNGYKNIHAGISIYYDYIFFKMLLSNHRFNDIDYGIQLNIEVFGIEPFIRVNLDKDIKTGISLKFKFPVL